MLGADVNTRRRWGGDRCVSGRQHGRSHGSGRRDSAGGQEPPGQRASWAGTHDRHGSPGASESRKEKEAEQQQARAFQECPPEGTGEGEAGSPDERVEGAVRKGCLQEGVQAAGTHHSQVSQESFCSSQE